MRGRYIQDSSEILRMFHFAAPEQKLQAIEVHCFHFYGMLLANLFGEAANKYYRSVNTTIKLLWDVPRATHTYVLHNVLAADFILVRYKMMSRYMNFFRSLLESESKEIRVAANIVGQDVQTVTGYNLAKMEREMEVDPWTDSPSSIWAAFEPVQPPEPDKWRISFLKKLLLQRAEHHNNLEDSSDIDELINELCIN